MLSFKTLLFYVPYSSYRGLNKDQRRLTKKGRRNRTYDLANTTGLAGIEIFVLLEVMYSGMLGGNKVDWFPMPGLESITQWQSVMTQKTYTLTRHWCVKIVGTFKFTTRYYHIILRKIPFSNILKNVLCLINEVLGN